MSGASAFKLLPLPQEHIKAQDCDPNGLSPLQIAVVNLLFIFFEHSHQLDNYHDDVLLILKELYRSSRDRGTWAALTTPQATPDTYNAIISKLLEIFDFEFVPGRDDEKMRHIVLKQYISDNYYATAMNSLKYLMDNKRSLPVMLPECLLPPEGPNAWTQTEDDLRNDMKHEFAAEEAVTAAQSAADLHRPLQYYEKVISKGIGKMIPLFNHAKVNPGSIDEYVEIELLLVNALQKVKKWIKEQPNANNPRKRSRSSSSSPLRRSDRLHKKGGRKIKTVRKVNKRNKTNKTKSRRV